MRRYNVEEAAEFLGIKSDSLMNYVWSGKIKAEKEGCGRVFEEDALKEYRREHARYPISEADRRRRFDKKRGKGAYKRLLKLLKEPLSSQEIADEMKISRQYVGQLHDRIFPDAARRGERLRAFRIAKMTQELFDSGLFSAFYRLVAGHVPAERIEPLSETNRLRLRKRAAKIDGRKVLLRKASRVIRLESVYRGRVYVIRNYSREHADYIFYLLGGNNFLFVPKHGLPESTRYTDSKASKYHKFKNNLDALRER